MRYHKYSFKKIKPKVVNDLVRIGNKEKDGGYIVSERQIARSKVLIGLGINYDWTFEEEFKNRNKDLSVYGYDFSIGTDVYIKGFISSLIGVISPSSYTKEIFNKRSPLPVLARPAHQISTYFKFRSFFDPAKKNFFFKEGVSDANYDQFITMHEVVKKIPGFDQLPDDSVYLKMDIEGSEFDILEDVMAYADKINGMVIEFHDLRHMWADFNFLIEKLAEKFEIIHIHGNNCCGYIPGTQIPNMVELSLIKRSLMTPQELAAANTSSYPLDRLDKPNTPGRSDLKIGFE